MGRKLALSASLLEHFNCVKVNYLTRFGVHIGAYVGPRGFLNEAALTMLALISYISAAVLLVTNLFVREKVLSRLGTLTVAAGIGFNFSGWMIRWIEAGEAEGWRSIGGHRDRCNPVWPPDLRYDRRIRRALPR